MHKLKLLLCGRWDVSLVILSLLFLVACSTPTNESTNNHSNETEPNHDDEAGSEHNNDHEEGEEPQRIPNNGAVIRIVSPEDGTTFSTDEDIVVEINAENFAIGEDGNHWELYVDGSRYSTIEDGILDEVVRGLEPGEHEIAAFLANVHHEELEEGDSITITISES